MTLDELAFIERGMADAGASGDVIARLTSLAAEWRRTKLEARRQARLARQAAVEVAASESGFLDEEADLVRFSTAQETENRTSEAGFWMASAGAANENSRKAIAFKVLALAPGFSAEQRAIGGRLVDHWNATTGRCDAAMLTLAREAGYLGKFADRIPRRVVAKFQAWGLVTRHEMHGRHKSNQIDIHFEIFASIGAELELPIENRTHEAARPRSRVRQTHKELQSSVPGEREVARDPHRQLELPGTMGVVAGTESRRVKALQRAEESILAKHPAFKPEIHAALARLGEIERILIADAELEQAGDGCRTAERLIGIGRGPPRRSGTG